MGDRILLFDNNQNRYIKIAKERAEKEDYLGALNLLFTALNEKETYILFKEIAKIYSEMELYEMSNLYWFRFMFCAPKEEVSTSYEELAINFFYLDNLWASGYYFHKKLSTDGYISEQNIDQEIMEFFSGEDIKKHAYRIVYPYNLADYSLELKSAKRAIRTGDFNVATESLEKIPLECRDEQALNDLSVSYMLIDDYKNAEKTARFSIEKFGESVNAYCNLSALFDLQKDVDNGEYYYKKALSLFTGEQEEYYKIVSCAIERQDHLTIKKCFENILKDRPHDFIMRFFYSISLINLHSYQSALREMKSVYMYNPKDFIVEYYISLINKLINNVDDVDSVLPVKYNKELPKKIAEKYQRKIRDLAKNPHKVPSEIKKEEVMKILTWGMLFGNDTCMRQSVMVLANSDMKVFKEFALKGLLNPEADANLKRLLIYALILKGYKGKLAIVASSYYCEFSLKKLLCEKSEESKIYISAYALCVSRTLFYGIDDFSKMAKTTDRLFYNFGNIITQAEVNNEELGALILLQSNYENFNKIKAVLPIFEVDESKLKKLNDIVNMQ